MEKINMEKIKENVIFLNKTKNSGIESQATYYANYIKINEVIIRGNLLEVNILALIRNRDDDNETSIFLEVYNKDCENFNKNFIQFNFNYRDLEENGNYSFNDALLKAILQTVRIQTINN